MSNRVRNIIGVVTAPATTPGSFNMLPLSAQVKVVFSCNARVSSGIKFWDGLLSKADTQEFMKKRAVGEINQRMRVQHTLYDFLNRASHYSSGKETEVKHDLAHMSIDTAPEDCVLENDEYEFSTQVINGNPFAWAKALLMANGEWPEDWQAPDEPLDPLLWEVERTYSKYAARYTALTILAEMGLYNPPSKKDDDTPSDIVMIAACSSKLQEIARAKSQPLLLRGLKALLRTYYGTLGLEVTQYQNGEQVKRTWLADEIIQTLDDAISLDKADADAEAEQAEDERVQKETKEFQASIKAAVRSAIMTATVMKEVTDAAGKMKAAGVGDAAISAMMEGIMTKLTAKM